MSISDQRMPSTSSLRRPPRQQDQLVERPVRVFHRRRRHPVRPQLGHVECPLSHRPFQLHHIRSDIGDGVARQAVALVPGRAVRPDEEPLDKAKCLQRAAGNAPAADVVDQLAHVGLRDVRDRFVDPAVAVRIEEFRAEGRRVLSGVAVAYPVGQPGDVVLHRRPESPALVDGSLPLAPLGLLPRVQPELEQPVPVGCDLAGALQRRFRKRPDLEAGRIARPGTPDDQLEHLVPSSDPEKQVRDFSVGPLAALFLLLEPELLDPLGVQCACSGHDCTPRRVNAWSTKWRPKGCPASRRAKPRTPSNATISAGSNRMVTMGTIAQRVPAPHNRLVGGSSPSGPTIYFQYVMMNGGIPISVCRCISGNDECGPIRNLRTTFVRVALETHRDWG